MVQYVLKNGYESGVESNGADLVYTGDDLSNYTDIFDNAKTEVT